jgi:integrase family protein with SAM-like domain
VVRPTPALTTAAVIEEFIEAAEQGQTVNRSGRRYRPSALRDLSGILRYHVAPELGELPLREVRRADVQALVNRLAEEGLSESRIRSVISALRALYGHAIDQGHVEFNPADGLVMPRGGGQRFSRKESPRADEPTWDEPPAPEEPPSREDAPRRRQAPRDRSGDRGGYQPMAVMPERILTFALRAVFVLFIVVALVSLLQPA